MKITSAQRIVRIVACLALIGFACLATPLLRERPNISPIEMKDEPEEFRLTSEFAAENDREVLAAVLERFCDKGTRILMLSDQPIERADNREQLGLDVFPHGLSCSLVQMEASEKLSNSVSNCPEKAKPALPSTSSWPCFNYHYPTASGILTLSLPFYYQENGLVASVESGISCGWLCGSGFEYLLRKVNGKWKVVETNSTWIA